MDLFNKCWRSWRYMRDFGTKDQNLVGCDKELSVTVKWTIYPLGTSK